MKGHLTYTCHKINQKWGGPTKKSAAPVQQRSPKDTEKTVYLFFYLAFAAPLLSTHSRPPLTNPLTLPTNHEPLEPPPPAPPRPRRRRRRRRRMLLLLLRLLTCCEDPQNYPAQQSAATCSDLLTRPPPCRHPSQSTCIFLQNATAEVRIARSTTFTNGSQNRSNHQTGQGGNLAQRPLCWR